MSLGSIFGTDVNAGAAKRAAAKSSKLTKKGGKKASSEIETNYAKSAQELRGINDLFSPYNANGQSLNNLYTGALGGNGQEGYDAATSAFHNTPGFQFGLDAANQNIMRNQAALGGLGSGNTFNALGAEAQGRQNQEYNTWLDNLYRGGSQGLMGAQGQSQGLQQLGSLFQNQGNNQAQIKLGTFNNLAGIQQQLGQNQQSAQTANAQNNAALWNTIINAGAKVAGSFA